MSPVKIGSLIRYVPESPEIEPSLGIIYDIIPHGTLKEIVHVWWFDDGFNSQEPYDDFIEQLEAKGYTVDVV